MQRLKAALMMVGAEFFIAAFTISYKLAANDNINMSVLITYRYLFGGILIFPVALFLERNKRPKLTWTILFQAFICTTFGGPMSQTLYAKSLALTSATFAAAFTNLIPPLTFIIAVLFRLEKVGISKISGKAKVIGTLVGVGGAMILTFYKGRQLNIMSTHFDLLHDGQHMDGHVGGHHKRSTYDHIFGSALALAYSLTVALFYNFQSILGGNYPCPYSNTFLFTVIGLTQSLVYGVITVRSWSDWKLDSKMKLLSAICQGVSSILSLVLIMAAVHLQGPLFVSNFNPLVLVFVAIAGFLVLDEKLTVGSLIGSIIIIAGLYMVLWGKGKESKRLSKLTPSGSLKDVDGASNVIATTNLKSVPITGDSCSIDVDEKDQLPANSPREKHKEQQVVKEV